MTNDNPHTLTLTTRGTVTEVRSDAKCSCDEWRCSGYPPVTAYEKWLAHSVQKSYQRQFTNA